MKSDIGCDDDKETLAASCHRRGMKEKERKKERAADGSIDPYREGIYKVEGGKVEKMSPRAARSFYCQKSQHAGEGNLHSGNVYSTCTLWSTNRLSRKELVKYNNADGKEGKKA
jgi:hypothetical protein